MALDPKEFRRRRHQREQQRYQKQERRKHLLIRLGIAAAVIIGVLILILVISSYSGSSDEPATAATSAPTEPTGSTESLQAADATVPTEPVDENVTVIHLAAAGDLNVTKAVVDSYEGDYDYTKLLMDVTPALADADITTVNLEGTFFTAPYGEDYSAPPALAEALDSAGVDLIQLANSYSIYKGMAGLSQTYSTIRTAGMEPVGAWPDSNTAERSRGFTLCSVQGVKIAFVAFTKGMNGMALPPGSEDCVNLLYTDYSSDYQTVDTQGITSILNAVKAEKPDLTVALVHWGSEYNNSISSSQEQVCDLLQKNGVDAIIGTHPHYVQKIDHDPLTGSLVAYSLGDFMGDGTRSGTEYSLILDLEITKDHSSGRTRITNYSYTPIFTSKKEDGTVQLLRIHQAMQAYEQGFLDRVTDEEYDAMKYALERIEARIQGN